MSRRIGILGGTFDPIHCGHIDVALAAEQALALQRILVVTANLPPHRQQPFASPYHRFAMTAIAIGGRRNWRALDLELRNESYSYTSHTLRRFHDRGYKPHEIFFIIGADAFADIGAWHEYPAVLDLAQFAVVSRPGYPVADVPKRLTALAGRITKPPAEASASNETRIFLIDAATADVSSTAIRQRRAAGLSTAGLVPPGVQQHIEQHGLYTTFPPGRRATDAPDPPPAGRMHGKD
jgi:nicotinate-nucleotide adenylyltransferase